MVNRVFVTGISGYIGSKLARYLAGKGEEVHGLIRKSSDLSLLGNDRRKIFLHTFEGTIDSLVDVLLHVRPATVFHLASRFKGQHVAADVVPLVESNVLFGAQLLEAMSLSGVRNLVNAGTFWQNFEAEAYNPVALYAATKQAFEDLLRFYTELGAIRAITLRLTDIYGPEDPRTKIFNLLLRACATNEAFGMTEGQQLIDVVHIEDVVHAFEVASQTLIQSDFKHRVRLVSSGKPITLRSLVEIFEKTSGRKVPAVWGQLPYRPREMFSSWQSDPMLEGWRAEIALEDGIRSILE